MGLKGAPIAALTFENVKVPAELIVKTHDANWRDTVLLGPLIALGRLNSLGSASVSMSKQCLSWAKQISQAKQVNGKPLIEYDEIKKNILRSETEVFALETLVLWCLFDSDGLRIADRWWELYIAKNITTLTLAQIADRSLSVFGAEGYEAASSKVQLGLAALPIEQIYRDARGLRISGGVDFYVDYNAAMQWLSTFYYNTNFDIEAVRRPYATVKASPNLAKRNLKHFANIESRVGHFYDLVRTLVAKYPDKTEFFKKERTLILLNQISTELFMSALVLARASRTRTDAGEQNLADTYCTYSEFKLAQLESELSFETEAN